MPGTNDTIAIDKLLSIDKFVMEFTNLLYLTTERRAVKKKKV